MVTLQEKKYNKTVTNNSLDKSVLVSLLYPNGFRGFCLKSYEGNKI